jgi:MSHA pilin protein MshC
MAEGAKSALCAFGRLATKRSTHERSAGFTIVELVTTLVIIGLLTAVAAPRFFDHQPFVARGYVDELAGAMRLGREIALASQCEVQVVIDDAGGYSLWQRAADLANNTCFSAGAWSVPVRGSDGSSVIGTAPDRVNVAPAATFQFAADGSIPALPPAITIDTFTITVGGEGQVLVTP